MLCLPSKASQSLLSLQSLSNQVLQAFSYDAPYEQHTFVRSRRGYLQHVNHFD